MQNKGFIKGIAILFALACLFHLSFTFVTARVEKKLGLLHMAKKRKWRQALLQETT
jgi:hypothetical protein